MTKKTLTLMSALAFVSLFFMVSCGGGAPKEAETTDVETTEEAAVITEEASDEIPEKDALGKEIYDTKCVVCHLADGNGMPGAFPPIANSDYLLEDPIRGINQTLNGSYEEMVVNGATYNAPMTPQVDTKEEALAVINYVLKYFNDTDVQLTMDDITAIEIKAREE